jgi:hypothetical protein
MPTPRSSVERVENAVMAIVRPVRLALAADAREHRRRITQTYGSDGCHALLRPDAESG